MDKKADIQVVIGQLSEELARLTVDNMILNNIIKQYKEEAETDAG